MITRIRGARVNFKTGIVIIALALLVWAAVAYVRIRDFVPEELTHPAEAPRG